MSFKKLDDFLLAAVNQEQADINERNPFKLVSFDHGQKRLGWMRVLAFAQIKQALENAATVLKDKQYFIFCGIGGSGNGIKVVNSLFKNKNIFVLDSLDPVSLKEVLKKIPQKEKSIVIPISKSGTTKETQLIALSLRQIYGDSWANHFLWLADLPAFAKLDSLGWQQAKKLAIQIDQETDIGGRFSCPHTLIFWLPLFILLDYDLARLQQIYQEFTEKLTLIRKKAFSAANKAKLLEKAYFYARVPANLKEAFAPWVTQLIQESLGSKIGGLAVKTITFASQENPDFLPVKLAKISSNQIVNLMAQEYFYQVFTAYYAALKGINFVSQDYVETYKAQMRELEGQNVAALDNLDLAGLIQAIKNKISADKKFIEIVLYFNAKPKLIKQLRTELKQAFSDKIIFVFVGSDWNHHSYQAAFNDQETFFGLILAGDYKNRVKGIAAKTLNENIATLKIIAKATYLTIKDKAIFIGLSI